MDQEDIFATIGPLAQDYDWSDETPHSLAERQTAALQILELWSSTTPRGRRLRKFSRQLNGALALASQVAGGQRQPSAGEGGQWNPCVRISGRVYHLLSALHPEAGAPRRYAQMYLHDPHMEEGTEAQLRLNGMPLPDGTTPDILAALEDDLQFYADVLRRCNPFVRDFMLLNEIPERHVRDRTFVLSERPMNREEHAERYGRPKGFRELAILLDDQSCCRDVVVRLRHTEGEFRLQRIPETSRIYHALHFPLLFPLGDTGFYKGMPAVPSPTAAANSRRDRQRQTLSCREYCAYQMHLREGEYPHLFFAGRLFQELLLSYFAQNENIVMDYLQYQHHNRNMRGDNWNNVAQVHRDAGPPPQQLEDAVDPGDYCGFCEDADADAAAAMPQVAEEVRTGQKILLPASFTGGPKYMRERYLDAMATVGKHGKPDMFITITFNPKWEEALSVLLPGQ
eukprot:GHVU01184198.1.p1 GENE.GHVU01184198.1~~GHVU01184198.1.p1  ORF type:complete len:454 (+),score=38.23 GHVU01184198.1:2488-3849(+)